MRLVKVCYKTYMYALLVLRLLDTISSTQKCLIETRKTRYLLHNSESKLFHRVDSISDADDSPRHEQKTLMREMMCNLLQVNQKIIYSSWGKRFAPFNRCLTAKSHSWVGSRVLKYCWTYCNYFYCSIYRMWVYLSFSCYQTLAFFTLRK